MRHARPVIHTVGVDAGCEQGQVTWRYPHRSGLRISFAAAAAAADASHDDDRSVKRFTDSTHFLIILLLLL